jgi:hypothetical protein
VTEQASFAAAIKTGEWSTGTVGWLRGLALGSICLDSATTWYVLASDRYIEYNPVIGGLWEIDPLVAMAYFVGTTLVLAGICTRRLGWVSTAFAAHLTVVMGVFGGLNNLALFVFGGPSLVDMLATLPVPDAAVSHSLIAPLGGLVGLGVARFRHGRLPGAKWPP